MTPSQHPKVRQTLDALLPLEPATRLQRLQQLRPAIDSALAQAPPGGIWVWASQLRMVCAAASLPAVANLRVTRAKASGCGAAMRAQQPCVADGVNPTERSTKWLTIGRWFAYDQPNG